MKPPEAKETDKHPRELKLSLLENGIDFIRSGVEQFFMDDRPDNRAHKYALLHLFAGIVLILKERLARAHPSLIFDDVKRMGDDSAKTVGFDETLKRLKACAGVGLKSPDEQRLRRARLLRNKLEHYECELNLTDAQAVVGALAEFAYLFLRQELGTKLEDYLPHEVRERVWELRRVSEQLEKERKDNWQKRASELSEVSDEGLEALFERTQYHPRDNPIPGWAYDCPVCGEERVVTVHLDIAVCTNPECREIFEIDRCLRCDGALFESGVFCEECQDYLDAQKG